MSSAGGQYRLFWQEFRRTFETTGAVLPSGPALCRALAAFVRSPGADGQRRILEVGPGTGVVTGEIIARLGPDDTLDVVELNDRFVELLRTRLEHDPTWSPARERVRIHHCPVQELAASGRYDAIVSGLPLNNFPGPLVSEILEKLESLAHPGGTLSFFEYVAVRRMKALLCRRPERERLRAVAGAIEGACRGREFQRDCVLANVPPAWVHHLRFA